MQPKVTLVAMPWPPLQYPSIQIGALKAWLDRAVGDRVRTDCWSGFLSIPAEIDPTEPLKGADWRRHAGEFVYLLLFNDRFKLLKDVSNAQLLRQYNTHRKKRLTRTLLRKIQKATETCIERELVPKLSKKHLNIVGFTLNFDQTYSSLYCAEYLRKKHPKLKTLFVFGGWGTSVSSMVEVIRHVLPDSLCVLGEGEEKLTQLVELLNEKNPASAEEAIQYSANAIAGVFRAGDASEPRNKDREHFRSQVPLESLPLPNYDEYVETGKTIFGPAIWKEIQPRTVLLVEGSRGCFAHCDFCGLNAMWDGFRKKTPRKVYDSVKELSRRYHSKNFQFVDNVCDTWAEEFADLLLQNNEKIHSMFELRAHHPQEFWTKLALSGCSTIQVGTEAIAPGLLKKIGKGTTVIQNLSVQKWLRELHIDSVSNLITHHPKSTFEDVQETDRVLQQIPHFGDYFMSTFRLDPGSRMAAALKPEEKAALKMAWAPVKLEGASEKFLLSSGYDPQDTDTWKADPAVRKAWALLAKRYAERNAQLGSKTCQMIQERLPDGALRLLDTRFGTAREHRLEGDRARVYEACHRGLKVRFIANRSCVSEEQVVRILREFLEQQIVLETEDHFLALALRPRDQLVKELGEPPSFALSRLEPTRKTETSCVTE